MDVTAGGLSVRKNSIRRLLFIMTALILMCAATVIVIGDSDDSDASSPFTVDGIKYMVTSEYTVEVISNSYSGSVTIPSTVDDSNITYLVTSIGNYAFFGCTSLTSVTIGNNVISIGDQAFYECTSLTSVTIGNSVTSIGNNAFYACKSLTSVVIPNSVTSIGNGALSYCSSLTSVTISNSVTSIGNNAFSGCKMKYLCMHSCTLTSSYSLEKGLEKISIDKGTKGLSTFLANYEFCTSEGLCLNKTMLSGYVYESNDEGAMIRTGEVTNTYVVSFVNGDDTILTSDYEYGATIVAPTETPLKQSTVQYLYTFDHWDGFTEGMTVTGDQTFHAVFNETVRTYRMTFTDMGNTYYEYNAQYDSVVSVPDTNPTRPSDGNCDYRFVSWNGYSDGMKVTGDMTFTSSFEAVLKSIDTSGDIVTIDTKTVSDVRVSSTMVDSIRTAGNDGKSTDIKMLNGTILIDSASAAGLPKGEQTISFTEADRTKISAGIADKIGDRPVYSISIGDVHEFNGTLTISVRYDLQEGEKAENIYIWYLKSDGSYERIACAYSEGYATFTTNHLSDYAVMVESNSDPTPSSSSDNNGGMNIGITIGIIVAAIVLIALIAVLVIKRKKRTGEQ